MIYLRPYVIRFFTLEAHVYDLTHVNSHTREKKRSATTFLDTELYTWEHESDV